MPRSKVDKLIRKQGKENDKLNKKLNPTGTRYILLQNDGATNNFTELLELTKTYHEYINWRRQTKVSTGRNDPEFVEALRIATDIGIGAPNSETGEIILECYELEQRDKVPPTGERPAWEYFGTKTGEWHIPEQQ